MSKNACCWSVTLLTFGLTLNVVPVSFLMSIPVWAFWFLMSAIPGVFFGSWLFGWLDDD